jgi:hypothetical protein
MSRLEATTGLKGWDDSNSTPMLKDFDFLGMLALGAGAIPFWRLP